MYVCPVSWITQVFVELHGTNMAASNKALCLEILGKIDVPVCFLIISTILYAFICTVLAVYVLYMYIHTQLPTLLQYFKVCTV